MVIQGLNKKLTHLPGLRRMDLFSELITSVIQIEFTVAKERSFIGRDLCSKHFYHRFKDSCIYYSYSYGTLHRWKEHVGDQEKKEGIVFTASSKLFPFMKGKRKLVGM